MAPDLVEVYAQFSTRGVAFVGLTAWHEDAAREYSSTFKVPWTIGFNSEETIRNLGAAAATLMVVGRDGRVVWSDDGARYNHDIDHLRKNLEQAIEKALAQPNVSKPPKRA